MTEPSTPTESIALLDQVAWNEHGLVPAIAQEVDTGQVLMLAWMNRDALTQTLATGFATYWSRSRGVLWRKGVDSGHVQVIKEIRLDCDNDALLLRVEQKGGIACHTGRHHCFFQMPDHGHWRTVEPVKKDPKDIYRGS